ncbi:hypothetical protein CC2G_010056 [Coprinopsis cinerea AmutBmut pab1-1]|nr:hypothetical protein CC2G_010056 [Coprinopsis cinerea AmutBmut pab1-1]
MDDFLSSPLPSSTTSEILGNASTELKEIAVKWYFLFRSSGSDFGKTCSELKVTEVWVQDHVDSEDIGAQNESVEERVRRGHPTGQREVKMVAEVEVKPEMCDGEGYLHNGCMALIIDEGSAIALLVHKVLEGGRNIIGVSQNINILYHAPAPVGTRLRIVNRSVTTAGVLGTCRSDIWDKDTNRLIATGLQSQADRNNV